MTAERALNTDDAKGPVLRVINGKDAPLAASEPDFEATMTPTVVEPSVNDRLELSAKLKALKHFGRSTHSFLTLYEGVKYFQAPGIKGYVPITESKGFILITGEPVCDLGKGRLLMESLKDYARAQEASLGAVPVGEKAKNFLADCGFHTIYVGREPIFDLTDLPKLSKSIRQAINRVTRKGYRVIEFSTASADSGLDDTGSNYQEQIEALCQKWKAARELPPMGFLFELRPLELSEHKKYFLLLDSQDNVQSFLACSPIFAKDGWYLEDLVRDGKAPNGCTELLVTEALNKLAAQGHKMATLGLAPLAGLPDHDEKRPRLNKILRFCYEHLSFIYHFQALHHFKAKFHPKRWENNYFCHYSTGSKLALAANLFGSFGNFDMLEIIKHKWQKWTARWAQEGEESGEESKA